MAEGQEVPDQEGDAGSQNSQSESPLGPSDAQRDAKENLADKVDDNKVEAAGHKGGLKAAFAARLNSWHETLLRIQEEEYERVQRRESDVSNRLSSKVEAGQLHGKESIQVLIQPFREIESIAIKRGPLLLGAVMVGALRDRLQPKPQMPKAPPSAK